MRRETFATDRPPRLVVHLPAGRVDLETAETDETVVELEALNERGREAVESAFIGFHGDELRVDVDERRFLLAGRTPQLHVTVRAPYGSHAKVTSAAADVTGRGRFG